MVDYSRWDNLDESDDDDADEVASGGRVAESLEHRREKLRAAVGSLLRIHPDGLASEDLATLAYFAAATSREPGATDNRERHLAVIDLLANRPVLASPQASDAMCRAARDAVEAQDDGLGACCLEAVNTLEACRRYGGALALYARICAPADERSRALLALYAENKFGELRLKRHVFGSTDAAMAQALDAHEREVLKSVDPPPPARPRKRSWLPLWLCGLVAVAGLAATTTRAPATVLEDAPPAAPAEVLEAVEPPIAKSPRRGPEWWRKLRGRGGGESEVARLERELARARERAATEEG
mmetsp:Transcript_4268/g.12609  ORF Transcript_4268/g.12609 Transcript_4268/m.12609 type:complete len:299 (+) Transcript_4268:186-1082(+)